MIFTGIHSLFAVASEEVLEGLDIFLIAIVIILVLIGSIFLTCMGVMFVIRSATDCGKKHFVQDNVAVY